jgi:hypothetical protein
MGDPPAASSTPATPPSSEPPIRVEALEQLSKKELQKRANEYFAQLETCGHEQEPAVLAKAQFYLRQLEHRWDSRVSIRDLILEIIVILLIGGEIYMSIRQEGQQRTNFNDQQTVLKNMLTSSQKTAETLTALKSTTEVMNQAVGRNAAASEQSAETASRTLHMSERAYVTASVYLSSPPTAGQPVHAVAKLANSGRTTAVDLSSKFRLIFVLKQVSEKDAYTQAFTQVHLPYSSSTILGAGESTEMVTDTPRTLTAEEVKAIESRVMVLYAFVEVSYKDLFGRQHHTQRCTLYDSNIKGMIDCSTLNNAD